MGSKFLESQGRLVGQNHILDNTENVIGDMDGGFLGTLGRTYRDFYIFPKSPRIRNTEWKIRGKGKDEEKTLQVLDGFSFFFSLALSSTFYRKGERLCQNANTFFGYCRRRKMLEVGTRQSEFAQCIIIIVSFLRENEATIHGDWWHDMARLLGLRTTTKMEVE